MKRFLVCILILKGQALVAQVHADSIGKVIVPITLSFAKQREWKITSYADSINNYKGDIMPSFLFNACFDWNASLWEGLHSPVSLRWKILLKVNNKQTLKMILLTHDKRLRQRCSHISDDVYPYLAVPMIKKSFYQLIKERYRQLPPLARM
jgi:hypothetical protein